MLRSIVNIWIEKPNVIHKRIFGARILNVCEFSIVRTVYPSLRSKVDEFEERITTAEKVINFSSIHADYSICLKEECIEVSVNNLKSTQLFTLPWFTECLQDKLCHWIGAQVNYSPPSLECVNLADYQHFYAYLKLRYTKNLILSWCERTDPEKFIHEDIGIASYLMCLWKNSNKDIYFVDIGCGNGLLVFLLVSEGFRGIGLDIRKRKIWEQYPEAVKKCLVETTVDPSIHPGFPEANWLIGNHSDELTPWLPILAVRSNENCRVFTIPCCPFSLFQKFNLGNYFRHSKLDSYKKMIADRSPADDVVEETTEDYLIEKTEQKAETENNEGNMWFGRYRFYVRYLKDVFKLCGFEPEIDIMRIPSTKRMCVIGRVVNHEMDSLHRFSNIEHLLYMESSSRPTVNPGTSHFIPRDKDPSLKQPDLTKEELEDITTKVFKKVLEEPADSKHPCFDPRLIVSKSYGLKTTDERWWNPGGCLNVVDAIQMLDADTLAKMKMVKGGLQAILRSQHHAFIVTGRGIALRFDASRLMFQQPSVEKLPTSVKKTPTTKKTKRRDVALFKTKPCWMDRHHPDGCPYPHTTCNFVHACEQLLM